MAGDTVQIHNLKNYLRQFKINVDVDYSLNPELSGYDLIHCFNILRTDSCLPQCISVKNQKKPLILSPVYWDLTEYLQHVYPDKLCIWQNQQLKRKKILQMCDFLIPNGWGEYEKIKKDFKIKIPCDVVYNGVDLELYNSDIYFKNKKKYVLSVGRIHPRKNQLTLIKAVQGTGIPLIIIGAVNDRQYYRLCLKEAEKASVKFINCLEQKYLIKFYQNCCLHVLVSWYETPGLVNLEAAVCGAELITTDRGLPLEYFGKKVIYCSPGEVEPLRKKILNNYKIKRENELQEFTAQKYNWERAALQLKAIYRKILSY